MNMNKAIKVKKNPAKKRAFNQQVITDDLYKAVVSDAMEAFTLVNLDGYILDTNAAFCDMTSYSRDELLSMKIQDIEVGFTELSDKINLIDLGLEKSGKCLFETRHRRKDGKIIDVAINLKYLDEGLSFCFHRDITEDKLKLKHEALIRKQTEEALKESEDRYRALIDLGTKIGEAVVMLQDIGGSEGMHTYVSDQWPIITGYKKKELLNMPFFDLVNPKDREASLYRHRQKMAGKTMPELFELSIINKKGKKTPIEITSAVTVYRGKPTNVVYIRDITKRKELEKALVDSEEKYRALFEYLPIAIYELDYSWFINFKQTCIYKDGKNDLKQCLEEKPNDILASQELGHIVRTNQAALDLYEADNIEEMRNMVYSFVAKDKKGFEERKAFLVALDKKAGYTTNEETIITSKGNRKIVLTRTATPPACGANLSRVFISQIDITARKEAQEGVEKYKEHLEELVTKRTAELAEVNKQLREQIKQRIEFTRAIVHEMKTPLTPLLGASDLLCNNLKEEPWSTLAHQVYNGAVDLDKRIDELFTLTRSEVGKLKLHKTTIEPAAFLKDIVDYMMPQATKTNHKLIVDTPNTLPKVYCDPQCINQVFLNLIDNALKFTPEGTLITLKAQQKDSFLEFQVIDTGHGIPPNKMKYIFMPYVSLDDEMEHLSGLGLGLALCKNLVRLHSGDITVENKSGSGCCFTFTIPIAGKDSKTNKNTE